MWDQLQRFFIDLLRTLGIVGNLLLVQRIVEPEVNVALPEPLLRYWWHILDCTLEDRS